MPEKITSKRKTAAGRKNQQLIQLLRTRIFGTGRATEIMYIMTVAPPARGELTIGNVGSQVLVDRRADVGVAGRAQIFDPTE